MFDWPAILCLALAYPVLPMIVEINDVAKY